MRSSVIRVIASSVAVMAIATYAIRGFSANNNLPKNDPYGAAVDRGAKWLVSVQGKNGGWGQDGGETSYVRNGEHLESNGNDVANTAVAVEALLHAGNAADGGPYRDALQRAVAFILTRVEKSPSDGLAVTDLMGTQIQRKLGPYIDTFLTTKLLAELDGTMTTPEANARVRAALQKCVAKIEKNQLKDGSWNIAGGWAPILGTSMASRSLYMAQQKGVVVSAMAMAKVDEYTQKGAQAAPSVGVAGGVPGGIGSGMGRGGGAGRAEGRAYVAASPESAGVSLYQGAQRLEQLSRTEADRARNAKEISTIRGQLSNANFVNGYGSFGGEEFFSYLNISDSLHRTGGPEWEKWNHDIKDKIAKLQNEDGTWAGHHCITGRVAVTSAAILILLADHDTITPVKAKRG
jgi:Squalene-hopene cyclase C-terminal domain/Prenyltransferase and squalene oxidase repeat